MEDVENATWRFWARGEYIEAEQARLAEIEGTRLSDQDAGLEAEAAAIDARAYARAGTPELRAKVGILVAIDPEGTLAVERGLFAPPVVEAPQAAADPPRRQGRGFVGSGPGTGQAANDRRLGRGRRQRHGHDPHDPRGAQALVAIVSTRPDLALMFAVARFGGRHAPDRLEREFGLHPERLRRRPHPSRALSTS